MSNEQQVTVELNESLPGSHIRIRWSTHGMASAAVQMPATSAAVTWTGTPIEYHVAAVEKFLDEVKPSSNGTQFLLKIERPGRSVTAAAWNASGEPLDLRELRRELELMAHVPYLVAKASLIQGKDEEAAKAYAAAIRSYRTGIESLANLYSSAELLDDTGMKLVLARSNEEKGDLKTAATIYGRVLESRTHAYAEKHRLG